MSIRPRGIVGRGLAGAGSILALSALLSLVAFAVNKTTSNRSPVSQMVKTPAPAVTVAEAHKMTFVDNVLVTGSLVPREEVMVGPEIDGYRIVSLLAEEGDRVKAGQVLATLSRDILETQLSQNTASAARSQAAIDQVRSQITDSEATLGQVEEAFNRVKPLRQTGVASQATFEERDAAFRSARARLAGQKEGLKFAEADLQLMQAQRKELEVKLDRTDIRAPAGGIVSHRAARIGMVSSSNSEALFRIIRDGEIELDAEIPEFYMPKLRQGQHAEVEVAGAGDKFGTVRLVSPEVNVSSRLGRVRIFLGNGPDLRIGTFAKALIDAGQRDSVGVPTTAVLYQNDTATVLVVQDNTVRDRSVKTGLLSGDSVEIRDGLREGDIVVVRAGSLLRDGDVIAPQFLEKRTAAQTSANETGK